MADLYATVPVLVGDSCLAGDAKAYWSDRVPETTGRGGFLIHPWGAALAQYHKSLWFYPLGDFGELIAQIDRALESDYARKSIASSQREETKMHHTYEERIQSLIWLLDDPEYVPFWP